AQLEEYARTLPGRQSYRGALGAAIDLSGLGNNVRSIQGKGEAHITQGDLGELPVALRFINFLNSNLSLLDSPRTSLADRQRPDARGQRAIPYRSRAGSVCQSEVQARGASPGSETGRPAGPAESGLSRSRWRLPRITRTCVRNRRSQRR